MVQDFFPLTVSYSFYITCTINVKRDLHYKSKKWTKKPLEVSEHWPGLHRLSPKPELGQLSFWLGKQIEPILWWLHITWIFSNPWAKYFKFLNPQCKASGGGLDVPGLQIDSLVDAEDESLGLDLDDVAWGLWIFFLFLIFSFLILKKAGP